MSPFKFRPYRLSDLAAMFRLDEICFPPQFRFSRQAMKAFAEVPLAIVSIAECDEELVGFCIVHVSAIPSKRTGYIVTLDVDPRFRRQGLAGNLLDRVEDDALAGGCSSITLHVFEENVVAIRFYENHGFEFRHVEKNFYGAGSHAKVYRKLLRSDRPSRGERSVVVN